MNQLFDKATPHPAGYREVDPARVAPLRGRVRVVDVREPAELTGELGHAPGAEPVPLGRLATAVQTWDKEQEIVLVCRSGIRSARAAELLGSMGFRHVMNLRGGMLAWNDARLPVAR